MGSGLLFYGGAVKQNSDEGIVKVDHMWGTKDRLSLRYFVNNFQDFPPNDPKNLLTYVAISEIRSQSVVLNETRTFGPTLLNEAVFTYTRSFSARLPPSNMPTLGDLGVNVYQPTPKMIESGGVGVTGSFSIGVPPTAVFVRNNFEWSDTVRWVHGAHSFSFGGVVARERMDIVNQSMQYGNATFNGNVTNHAVAEFLLGRMQTWAQANGQYQDSRDTFPSVFLQDDIKVTRRLTLNFGNPLRAVFFLA